MSAYLQSDIYPTFEKITFTYELLENSPLVDLTKITGINNK